MWVSREGMGDITLALIMLISSLVCTSWRSDMKLGALIQQDLVDQSMHFHHTQLLKINVSTLALNVNQAIFQYPFSLHKESSSPQLIKIHSWQQLGKDILCLLQSLPPLPHVTIYHKRIEGKYCPFRHVHGFSFLWAMSILLSMSSQSLSMCLYFCCTPTCTVLTDLKLIGLTQILKVLFSFKTLPQYQQTQGCYRLIL